VGLFDSLRAAFTPNIPGSGNYPVVVYNTAQHETVLGQSVEELWRTQPYLRTLVTFLARNVAQLGLQSFQRVTETDRRRLRDDPLPQLLGRPNPSQTTYELIFNLVADLALWDEAIWLIRDDVNSPSKWNITPISPSWINRRGGGDVFAPEWIEFMVPGVGVPVQIPTSDLLWFHGWNPGRPSSASSPVEALKQILAEQISAQAYRQQVWQRGGRVGGFLSRPPGAKWDRKTRESFQRQWQERYAGNDGAKAGGTPILEDGMTYQRVGFSAHEDEWLDNAKLSFAMVASVYHVNPTMVGLLDNANFSNVREFRKQLYGDTLGSTISMIEDRINTFLVPRVTGTADAYVEFNIAEKLRGNFEEQAAALSSATGRPWMTADEARGINNMRSLGGDAAELVTPLNVLIGGQASPVDSGSQNVVPDPEQPKSLTPAVKAVGVSIKSSDAGEEWRAKAAEVLARFFKHQRGAVLGALGAKAGPAWWDEGRWNKELADDLYALAVTAATDMGRKQAETLGFPPDAYNEGQTLKFLRAVAESRAGAVNSTTRDRIQRAIDDGADPGGVFDEAATTRAVSAGAAFGAALAGFAVTESAKQTVGGKATKTWNTGANPRSEHAAMDGQTVPIGETFSNGADWPGDPVLGAEGVANCNCGVTVNY
jgi:HK97 family phage portal protein